MRCKVGTGSSPFLFLSSNSLLIIDPALWVLLPPSRFREIRQGEDSSRGGAKKEGDGVDIEDE